MGRFALHLHISQSQRRASTRAPLAIACGKYLTCIQRITTAATTYPSPCTTTPTPSLLAARHPSPQTLQLWTHALSGRMVDGARCPLVWATNHQLPPLPSRWDGRAPLAQPTGDAVQLHKSPAGAGAGVKQGRRPGRPDQASKAPPAAAAPPAPTAHTDTLPAPPRPASGHAQGPAPLSPYPARTWSFRSLKLPLLQSFLLFSVLLLPFYPTSLLLLSPSPPLLPLFLSIHSLSHSNSS